jgi:hypothetical protein
MGEEMADSILRTTGHFFYMPQSYDMGQTALLPVRRKACCGFFRPKNPTALAGFEPANSGTSMLTTRPLKPHNFV